jgi:hypothetical protein
MTSNNPFADRLREAAKEGYVNGTRRTYGRPQTDAGPEFTTPAARLSRKQMSLIIDLMNERDLGVETRPKYRARLVELAFRPYRIEKLDRVAASNLITYLFGLPMKSSGESGEESAPTAFDNIPAGHYAVEQDGGVVFLRVDRPLEGKWAGKVFVSLQHGDDYTNMGRQAGLTMLGRIMDQGVMHCSTRYGREIGKCGVCHRTLTNAESREAGIGPVCRDKL